MPKVKKKSTKKHKKNKELYMSEKKKKFLMWVVVISLGLLLLVSTYAWLSTSLNVRIENFKMTVARNSGLSISLDGITFSKSVEVSLETVIEKLGMTYPNHVNQWSANGLVPVSTPGLTSPYKDKFDFFGTAGVKYKGRNKDVGYVTTTAMNELKPATFNYFLAFDIFIRNETGSPVADNLFLDDTSFFEMDYNPAEVITDSEGFQELVGLVNSARIGFLKIGSVSRTASVNEIQNVGCNGSCYAVIWEPYNTLHGPLSIERAEKYGITLEDGTPFPTYAWVKPGGPMMTKNVVSGSPGMDMSYFKLQETETTLPLSLFPVPDAITKVRIYIWIEGQDIDSLETDSMGTKVSISLDFTKDTLGYSSFDE